MNQDAILITEDLGIGYPKQGGKPYTVLSNLNLSVNRGQVVCILGRNGSGKSTLLRTLAGIQSALSGNVIIAQQKVNVNQQKHLARLMSVVLTEKVQVKNLSVYDLVSMGRYPHINWLGRMGNEDREKIREALHQVSLDDFRSRDVQELSDGELQRTMIAKALAQDTPLILLDEPTAHLDLPNRIETMLLLRELALETNKAVVLTTHDLDLALQTADCLWLIQPDRGIVAGEPHEMVLNGSFEASFESIKVVKDASGRGFRIQYPRIRK
ncbi:MAG: ABC transporter ATP-binding protein [Bacteroidetes bacterium]|jgi:iron complex transport system ATP-binding protein|nr:ABC transporter ATP-binding protein [Bacteroidota bacterium]MBT4400752.1 ABC transporter ATP-binding protein [Bacteroidota bacterium]MBT4409617.1 ABC transporter ATP-binding protein [Bacteroidota bacterium]MBT5427605.1 ABC transporter ATP-binding protein [Bacteroidota bacterium]MBT7091906.1 ABC transporter ATP-binding protein [Bacteroidota bacterium]